MHLTDSRSARSARSRSSVPICRSPSAPPLAAQILGTGAVSVCFFGDGATNIGAFHEALNLAVGLEAAGDLRVREQPLRRVLAARPDHAVEDLADRAAPTRWPASQVDGNDVLAVRAAVARGRAPRAGRRRPDADRGPDLPPHGPLPQRSGHLPAGGRARPLEASATRSRCSSRRWRDHPAISQSDLDARPRAGGRRRGGRAGTRLPGQSPIRATGSTRLGGREMSEVTYREAVIRALGRRARERPAGGR